MKLCIKQKVFSFGDKFSVYDERGTEKFFVNGEVFTFGKKLHVSNASGEEVVFISQRIFSFKPRFEISISGKPAAEIVKEFTFFRHEYSIPQWNVKISGDFLAHDYAVSVNSSVVAQVSKEWFSWGDTYVIDIISPEYELLALACVLVADCCMERNND